ncbi:MAG TPA: hypothetical protein VFN85_12930 [Solirubrobacterales bacterium]|nr:hypothetical protein [Solirubrobacterales bacterium]
MTNRRAKIAAGATVAGLAVLGGVALGTNPGMPTASQQAASVNGSSPVVTSTSGAAAVPATQNAALHQTRPPIVTRASGGLGGTNFTEED